jgi:hypothetical protein
MLVCNAWTNPTKIGGSKPESDPKSDLAVKLDDLYGALPWGVPDARVTSLQQSLNQQLVAQGMSPIAVTGQLDAYTCGAMKWLDSKTGSEWIASWGKGCKSFANPIAISASSDPAPQPDVAPPTPVDDTTITGGKSKFTAASMVAGLAVVGIGGAIFYTVGKKKGWFK